jgi:hypothetical protein
MEIIDWFVSIVFGIKSQYFPKHEHSGCTKDDQFFGSADTLISSVGEMYFVC